MSLILSHLRAELAREDLLDSWMTMSVQQCWHLRAAPDQLPQLRERAANCLETLFVSVKCAADCALGSVEFREPVQHFSFLAGWMAGVGMPIGAVLQLAQCLEDAIRPAAPQAQPDLGRFFRSLSVALCEAHAVGLAQTFQERHRQIVERSQVVCALGSRVTALFLVGDPDKQALDDATSRLMMLTVMRDARSVILELSGLVEPLVVAPRALAMLSQHREALARRRVLVCGVPKGKLTAEHGALRVVFFEQLDVALGEAPLHRPSADDACDVL